MWLPPELRANIYERATYVNWSNADPWDLFPCLYGSYSSEFDDLAIEVLEDIRDRTRNRSDLSAEIFRELLCTAHFCDYGTSPRVCFATQAFEARLPRLIERWLEYYELKWGEPKSGRRIEGEE